MNSAKQAGHLFSPQSSLVILYAIGMYGMLASAHNDSQMLLRNIRESKMITNLINTVFISIDEHEFSFKLYTIPSWEVKVKLI